MKKILIGLLIIIVILAIAIISLVLFINPNNYRGYIEKQVKKQTGYELTLAGDLRWHIWPQVSLLTNQVEMRNPGADSPILKADNMRLDVELWPLLSRHIAIKQIFVKSAVININGKTSMPKIEKNTNTTNIDNRAVIAKPKDETQEKKWQFNLEKLQIVDGVVSWQRDQDDLIVFRDINIDVTKKDSHQMDVKLSGKVDRDQRNLTYSFSALVNTTGYPNALMLSLQQGSYHFSGLGINDYKGTIKGDVDLQRQPVDTVSFNNLQLAINNNPLTINGKAILDKHPTYQFSIQSPKVDLTSLHLTPKDSQGNHIQRASAEPVVIAVSTTQSPQTINEAQFLKAFDANIEINIGQFIYDKYLLSNMEFKANNHNGVMSSNGKAEGMGGNITLTGKVDGNVSKTSGNFLLNIHGVQLEKVLPILDINSGITGTGSLSGNFAISSLKMDRLFKTLTGNVKANLSDIKLDNFNIEKIIASALSQKESSLQAFITDNKETITKLSHVDIELSLAHGVADINSLKAESPVIALEGKGYLNYVSHYLDLKMDTHVLTGWNINKKLLKTLQKRAIPLRVYGPLDQLYYEVDVESLLRDTLKDTLKDKLNSEIEKNPEIKQLINSSGLKRLLNR